MTRTLRKAAVADEAPKLDALTGYDIEHAKVYARLLDAEADGADWMEASLTVLRIDPIASARSPSLGEPSVTREMDVRPRILACYACGWVMTDNAAKKVCPQAPTALSPLPLAGSVWPLCSLSALTARNEERPATNRTGR
jgi:rubrerythrin